jgi:hypothetical protein
MALRVIIPALALAGLATACGSNETPGTPLASNPFEAPQDGSGAGSGPETPAVFNVDACTMVPDNVLKELDLAKPGKGTFKPATPEDERNGNLCSWGKSPTSSPSLTIMITPGAPGAGKTGATPKESTVDGRKAVRYTEESKGGLLNTCETDIVVNPKVKVVVRADASDSVEALCAKVDKVLPSVSAKIPK